MAGYERRPDSREDTFRGPRFSDSQWAQMRMIQVGANCQHCEIEPAVILRGSTRYAASARGSTARCVARRRQQRGSAMTVRIFSFVTNSDGSVHGLAAIGTPEDHAEAAKWAREQKEAEGPPLAEEAEVCKVLNLPEYNETDPTSPWVAIRALSFPRPIPPRIITDTRTRKDSFAPLQWDRRAVRQWLEQFDAVAASIQPAAKRHRHLR